MKNNNLKKEIINKKNFNTLGYIFFGYVIATWISLYVVVQYSIELLWFISGVCIALCFIGFFYYWVKHHKIDEIKIDSAGPAEKDV